MVISSTNSATNIPYNVWYVRPWKFSNCSIGIELPLMKLKNLNPTSNTHPGFCFSVKSQSFLVPNPLNNQSDFLALIKDGIGKTGLVYYSAQLTSKTLQ